MVEHARRDDRCERAGIVELLERHAPEERAVGRPRVDAERVEAGVGERVGHAPFGPAANLEDARRGRRQVLEDEVEELGHARAGAGTAGTVPAGWPARTP